MDQNQSGSVKQAGHNPKTLKAMKSVSKVSLALGVIMVFAVLITAFVKYTTPVAPAKMLNKLSPTPRISVGPTIATLPLNLNDPLSCGYSNSEASVSAYIFEKKVAVSLREATSSTQLVLNNNCLYLWKNSETTGKKLCNIEPMLQAADLMAAFGGLTLGTLLNMLPVDDQSKVLSNTEFINKVIATCVKEASNSAVFAVPRNVVFKESTQSADLLP